ncbi:MAG: 3'-5' exonuclease [Elainellaceae cyanobacterium]
MEFRISDTFTDSLTTLTNQAQKATKTTAFDLQLDPASPGLRFHKLDRTKDPNFWSVSVNMDIRLIIHRTAASLMLCYVDHHDSAYKWASKRKIERHPRTGAAQLVEVRETVEEITIRKTVEVPTLVSPKPPLFTRFSDDDLLGYGIPPEWLQDVQAATEDTLFDVAEHLPQEAAEALLELATGGQPQPPASLPNNTDPFSHPDAQRRFRVMANQEELQRALAYPWEKWTVFLHPAQQQIVERDFSGPARISGSAGTGKTIVALHRAAFLARRHSQGRILLTTFSQTLANSLQLKRDRLIGNDTDLRDRIQVQSIRGIAHHLYAQAFGNPNLVKPQQVRALLLNTAAQQGSTVTNAFLWGEWHAVVDAWQLRTWEAYKAVPRLGRKTRLGSKQRESLWAIFQQVQQALEQENLLTWAGLFRCVTKYLAATDTRPFDFVIVDEAQDLGITELQFIAALGTRHPDSLFFTGDLGQRIFQQPYSWKSLGVDIRGRSQTLTINYRTSHQIRAAADRLLPTTIADVDGNVEERRHTVSVFNGPTPDVELCSNEESEIQFVGAWIAAHLSSGIQPDEIGIFVRTKEQMDRAIASVTASGASPTKLNNQIMSAQGCVAVSTMHLAKGLEFRAVVVMACDDEVMPLQERIEAISDEADLEEVYNTERHLLYVAATRARDYLLLTGVAPASEFLDDLNS